MGTNWIDFNMSITSVEMKPGNLVTDPKIDPLVGRLVQFAGHHNPYTGTSLSNPRMVDNDA